MNSEIIKLNTDWKKYLTWTVLLIIIPFIIGVIEVFFNGNSLIGDRKISFWIYMGALLGVGKYIINLIEILNQLIKFFKVSDTIVTITYGFIAFFLLPLLIIGLSQFLVFIIQSLLIFSVSLMSLILLLSLITLIIHSKIIEVLKTQNITYNLFGVIE